MHINTSDLTEARAVHGDLGGWLLDIGDGQYLVTDDEGTVRDLRGIDYLATCESQQRWDETVPAKVDAV